MTLITYDQAKARLRVGDEESDDLQLQMELATALVISYIKRPDHEWTVLTDKTEDLEFGVVQACILETLVNLWQHRGDTDAKVDERSGLTPRVTGALGMLRDPALA